MLLELGTIHFFKNNLWKWLAESLNAVRSLARPIKKRAGGGVYLRARLFSIMNLQGQEGEKKNSDVTRETPQWLSLSPSREPLFLKPLQPGNKQRDPLRVYSARCAGQRGSVLGQ